MACYLQPGLLPRTATLLPRLEDTADSESSLNIRQGSGRYARGRPMASSSVPMDSSGLNAEPEDPYKVLGVSPLDSFDAVKVALRKKSKDAAATGNEALAEKLERAYDSIMMQQLNRRKKGVTFGSVKVSEDIKYADSQDFFPWRPKYEKSGRKQVLLNAAFSAVMAVWALAAQFTDWKVLQLILSFYVFVLFLKLDPFYPPSPEDGEKRWERNGRRLLRCLGLVFGCVVVASFAYTGLLNGLPLLGLFVPRELFTFQELFVTLFTDVSLFFIGSYYR